MKVGMTQVSTKSQLGQFYTTNYQYILQNMKIPQDVKYIIEPFVGNGDLLNFIENQNQYTIEKYDIDPKIQDTVQCDTLLHPPIYDNKFVLTNPPYLARNKNIDKTLYDKYDCNDLYKCFITNLIASQECLGGIIIIPLNFMSSIRKSDVALRRKFLQVYSIEVMNIFEEKVFSDTSYAICSLQFTKTTSENDINVHIYPSKQILRTSLDATNNYTIGGSIYNLPVNPEYTIERATKMTKNKHYITNILLKCIDDSIDSQLGFSVVDDDNIYIDETENLTARSYASLVINKQLSIAEQEDLVKRMNLFILERRKEYNSLFLTNYRESNTIARKRISFDLAFRICNYVMTT
jgi:hypothetical protein